MRRHNPGGERNLQNAPQPVKDDFEECKNYWLREYPAIGEKTGGLSP